MAKIKRGASLRVEFDVGNFLADTMPLTARDIGELHLMLMAEAAREPIPPTKSRWVQRAFDRRREYSRIKGGFGREAISLAKRKEVYERDGGVCGYCRTPIEWSDYHCDHVEPVSKGGSSAIDNLRASCRPCNLSKAAKPLAEWAQ